MCPCVHSDHPAQQMFAHRHSVPGRAYEMCTAAIPTVWIRKLGNVCRSCILKLSQQSWWKAGIPLRVMAEPRISSSLWIKTTVFDYLQRICCVFTKCPTCFGISKKYKHCLLSIVAMTHNRSTSTDLYYLPRGASNEP